MNKTNPLCLLFGNDTKLLRRLEEEFMHFDFRMVPDDSLALLHRMRNVRAAIVLWRRDASEFAHRIQQESHGIHVVVQQNVRGLGTQMEKNGFAAVFDRAESRENIIRQLAGILIDEKTETAATRGRDFNFNGFLNHLPDTIAAVGDRARLADSLLASTLSALRCNQGALFLLEGSTFTTAASRNLTHSKLTSPIEKASSLGRSISQYEGPHMVNLADTPAEKYCLQNNCNLMLPLFTGSDLLGWFILNLRSEPSDLAIDSLCVMSALAAESLNQCNRSRVLGDEIELWKRAFADSTNIAISVGDDDTVEFLPTSLGRHASQDLLDLMKPSIRSAVTTARKGTSSTFDWVNSVDQGIWKGRAKAISPRKTLVTLNKSELPTKTPFEGASWRRVVLSILSNTGMVPADLQPLLGGISEMQSLEDQGNLSVTWLVTQLEHQEQVKVTFSGRGKDSYGESFVRCHAAIRVLLVAADQLLKCAAEKVAINVSHSPKRQTVNFDLGSTGLKRVDSTVFYDLATTGAGLEEVEIKTAAFGVRVTVKVEFCHILGAKTSEMGTFISQDPEIVLQTPRVTARNVPHGSQNGPTASSQNQQRSKALP